MTAEACQRQADIVKMMSDGKKTGQEVLIEGQANRGQGKRRMSKDNSRGLYFFL